MSGVVSAAKSVVGAITGQTGADAARGAARIQARAARKAGAAAGEFRDRGTQAAEALRARGVGYFQPYAEQAGYGLGGMRNLIEHGLQNFEGDPGFQFRLRTGQDATQRIAARGRSPYGSTALKAINDYSQQTASDEYARAFERMFGGYNALAGYGLAGRQGQAGVDQAATGMGMGVDQAATGMQVDAITGGANARAAGKVGAANAETQGIYNMINLGLSAAGTAGGLGWKPFG